MTLTAEWIDREREPKCKPDPAFPAGVDVDLSEGAVKTCSIELPYPAKRCGLFIVTCSKCGQRNAMTTAGRVDDVRRVTFGCYANKLSPHPSDQIDIILPDSSKIKRTPYQ